MGRNRYTAPSNEDEALEKLSKGWPKTISNPLHKQHQLSKSLRPQYNCDSCRTMGEGWSFCCSMCDFDLHPDCALESQLIEMGKPWPRTLNHRLHIDHALIKTRLDTFWCDSCGERGNWWSFYCERCDFSLHLQCALGPQTRNFAEDSQQPGSTALDLVKTVRESYWCSKCAEEGKGFCYSCEDVGVDLHPRCAAVKGTGWPRSIVHELHEHELVKSRSDGYWCDKCWIEGKGWYFSCSQCNFVLHPECAKKKVEVLGWVEQMAVDKRKAEALNQLQQLQQKETRTSVQGDDDYAEGEEDGNEYLRENQMKQMEDAVMQRIQLESVMSQLEQLRLHAELANKIRVDGAAAALEVVDGVPRRQRDPRYDWFNPNSGYGFY